MIDIKDVRNAVSKHKNHIMDETLALEWLDAPEDDMYIKEWMINGIKMKIGIKRISGRLNDSSKEL